ncbi:MAG TPA: hypothetical protein VM052_07480 [Candidatus Limnocylindrales bacterium]|nr:hypothetical protein [Candidatus Limnocylindrales bacterium]
MSGLPAAASDMSRLSFAFLIGGVAGILAAVQPLADTDMWWHLATGRETVQHGLVRADLFSWTVHGAPVSVDQWLGQVVMYVSYAVGDWRGVAILRVILVTALVTLVALAAARSASRPLAIVLASLPALLLTRAVWVDRPELFGFVCFAGLLLLLAISRDTIDAPTRTRALAAIVVLVGVWAQLHGSFALGVVVTLAACLEGALRDDPDRRRGYLACALATVAITFATPAGIGAWTAPGSHFLSPPRDIQEWNVIDVRTSLGVAYVATLGLVIALLFTGPRLLVRDIAILIPIAFLSLTAARQAPLLAIAAAPLFADRAQRALMRLGLRVAAAPETARGTAGRRVARSVLALAPGALLTVLALVLTPSAPDERVYPVAALTSIPSGDGTLARYEWGGWLIWRAPKTPVFVDGRLTPYTGPVLDDYRRIVAAAPGWRETITRRGVRTLLVTPIDPVAVRARELGWREIASSELFVLIQVP